MLEVLGLSKIEKGVFTVKNIGFTQNSGEKIAITGETGSGKTTLLKMIAGMLQPDEGAVYFEEERVLGPFEKLLPGHPSISYLSQHFELRNNYTVLEELESSRSLTKKEALKLYSSCNILHLLNRKTNELSGGERQRIVLVKLLITSPKLLVLDEPFSNLDLSQKNEIKSLLLAIESNFNVSFILVSHDAADTLSWADRIIVIRNGEIVQEGSPQEVYFFPANEYIAGLFGEYNRLNSKNAKALLYESQQALVRPEQLQVTNDSAKGVGGTVKGISFLGSSYLADILVNEQILKVRMYDDLIKIGDRIFIKVNMMRGL